MLRVWPYLHSPFKFVAIVVLHVCLYGAAWLAIEPLFTPAAFVLALVLIWMSAHDAMTLELPDIGSLALVVFGLLTSASLTGAVVSASLWAGIFYLTGRAVSYQVGRNALGFGDVKLMAGIGALLGSVGPVYVVLLASVSALLALMVLWFMNRRTLGDLSTTGIAFGPFLCLFTWVVWLYGGLI